MATEAQRNQVRLLIPDSADEQIYTDDEIDLFLDLEGDNVYRAAAQALDSIANLDLTTYRSVEIMDVVVNTAESGKELRYRADVLRKQAAAKDPWGHTSFYDVRDNTTRVI